MSRNRARSAAKVATLTNSDAESGLVILCALLMFASLVSMWSHWTRSWNRLAYILPVLLLVQ